ncbi:hypothetical protein SAMN04488111_0806 [Lutibacter flavus]|uniref:Uncharacterized protein n=1 Tax=Lutibacter flavus TaxID=691689 RepID=A0A238VPC2_9FLAO|nr:hypothetical protein SAMN04488111_0806 [Lutibacter flavus]
MLVAVKKQVVKIIKDTPKHIYINTLVPNFTYINEKGQVAFKYRYCIYL